MVNARNFYAPLFVKHYTSAALSFFFDDFQNLNRECLDTLFGRFDEQLIGVLAYIQPKEIETLRNVGDSGFLFREFQPPDGHQLPDRRDNVAFQNFFRYSGHNEIVCISDDIDVELSSCVYRRSHACINCRFKSIQCHIRDHWRNNSALWRARDGRGQSPFLDNGIE